MKELKTLRLDRQMTLREASEGSGLSIGRIFNAERPDCIPQIDTVAALARAYGGKIILSLNRNTIIISNVGRPQHRLKKRVRAKRRSKA